VSLVRRLADESRRFAFQGSLERRSCRHLGGEGVATKLHACAACESAGLHWVHLRTCLTCGTVACCDSSIGRHARRHFDTTGHPAIRSAEPGERWAWCYVDLAYASDLATRRE
jgi:uncharacterized UBP type Zn finger protein